jgi:hypothetical protein
MGTMLCRIHCFPAGDLCHPPNASAPKPWILVAIPPAIHRPLNEAALSSQTRIELSQRPTYRITLSLVMQPIPLVLVLRAAGAWIHAVFSLEILGQCVCVYRFNIAADRVLHLDAISRVLKCDPLNAVLILSDHKGRGRGNGARSSVWVDTGTSRWALVHP